MPLYNYICECGNDEEEIQPQHDIDRECWMCGQIMELVLHPPALNFIGEGWTPKHYPEED